MSKRRSYDWDFKAEVLATYEVDGPSAAARLYGVPVRTLKSWAQRLGLHTEADTKTATEAALKALRVRRLRIRDKLLANVEAMLDRMDEKTTIYVGSGAAPTPVDVDHPSASTCKDLATAAGILIDKFRLEQGEATGRGELSVTVTDEDRKKVEADVARAIAEAEKIAREAAT